MALDPAALLAQLRRQAGREGPLQCVLAWSGGLDSTVLLHLMLAAQRLRASRLAVRAVHVDHGLQPAAAQFRRFCTRTARLWRVPLTVRRVQVAVAPGGSVEEAARRVRRATLAAELAPGELLVAAQHADDQLETVLLALLRGAGPAGLAGMPESMPLGPSRLLRPLLATGREQIEAYAAAHGLDWVEDPSNAEVRFDRNYLRSHVLPALRQRWPAAARTVARSARHCASAVESLDRLAHADAQAAADGTGLQVAALRRLNPLRRAAALRHWITASGARAPNERHLAQVEAMMAARADAHPQLQLPDCRIHRERGSLWLSLRRAAR